MSEPLRRPRPVCAKCGHPIDWNQVYRQNGQDRLHDACWLKDRKEKGL